jgi:hypothetical protein
MFPPKPDSIAGATNAEPTNQTADLLFRIPLWMDLSMHLLPAVALIIGMNPLIHLGFSKLTIRLLCSRRKVQTASIDHRSCPPRWFLRIGLLGMDRTRFCY